MRYLCTSALTLAMLSGLVDAATITVPTDQPTIQAAIDAAVDGDLVLVQPAPMSNSTSYSRAKPLRCVEVPMPMGFQQRQSRPRVKAVSCHSHSPK